MVKFHSQHLVSVGSHGKAPFQFNFSANDFFLYSDTPWSMGLAALQAIPVLAGTENSSFDFTLYTGDLVSHDTEQQLSR